MKNLRFFYFLSIFLIILISGCKTIQNKGDEIAKKENEELSKLIGKKLEEVKIVMGNPSSELYSDDGFRLLYYKTKKYGILCERKFEFDESDRVIGFTSKGCF